MDALGRLAGGVAHDINNLLTALDMLASLIRSDVEHARPVESQFARGRAANAARRPTDRAASSLLQTPLLESRLLDSVGAEWRRSALRRLSSNKIRLDVHIPEEPILAGT
ncbi:MAG: hypothetical protein R3B07_31415 [Polyangiaceae bacterium]